MPTTTYTLNSIITGESREFTFNMATPATIEEFKQLMIDWVNADVDPYDRTDDAAAEAFLEWAGDHAIDTLGMDYYEYESFCMDNDMA